MVIHIVTYSESRVTVRYPKTSVLQCFTMKKDALTFKVKAMDEGPQGHYKIVESDLSDEYPLR